MATFIMTGKYTTDAVKQISAERTAKANQIVKQLGGSVVGVYATMGGTDLLAITEFPGINEALKASIELNKAMGIAFSTVPAMKVEEFDKLVGRKS